MTKHHNSAEEYIKDLISAIVESDEESEMSLPSELLAYWCKGVYDACHVKYISYIKGDVEDYKLDEDEVMGLLREASTKLIGDTLGELVDKGAISMSIGEDGEIYYKATEEGKSML